MDKTIKEKFKNTQLVILDCDGVLTDGYVQVDSAGNEYARFSHRDGMGVKLLKRAGMKVIVVTTQVSLYVTARCNKMQISCHQAVEDKTEFVRHLITMENIDPMNVLFMGDDVQDLGPMSIVGLPVAVADAVGKVKTRAVYVTERKGGEHAVREICDLILSAKGGA